MKKMYPQVSFTKKAKLVVFDDKTKEDELEKDSERDGQKAEDESVGSEKDGQKAEVSFEFELEGLKKDDQKACEDKSEAGVSFEFESEGLKKDDQKACEVKSESSEVDDQNNQNPFIAIDWHEYVVRKDSGS
jgi:hypothetical protein